MLSLSQQLQLQSVIVSIVELLWLYPIHKWFRAYPENVGFLQISYTESRLPFLGHSPSSLQHLWFFSTSLPFSASMTADILPECRIAAWRAHHSVPSCLKLLKTGYSPPAILFLSISASLWNLPALVTPQLLQTVLLSSRMHSDSLYSVFSSMFSKELILLLCIILYFTLYTYI